MVKQVKISKDSCEQCICEECCAQIPPSAAITAEGADYVHHFCGQPCYEKWQSKHKQMGENCDEQ